MNNLLANWSFKSSNNKQNSGCKLLVEGERSLLCISLETRARGGLRSLPQIKHKKGQVNSKSSSASLLKVSPSTHVLPMYLTILLSFLSLLHMARSRQEDIWEHLFKS